MAQLAGHELPADCGQAGVPATFRHRVLPRINSEEAHVDVRTAAGRIGKGLGHEGREESFLPRDLFHAVLETESTVRSSHATARHIVDLPLRARVLAVGRDDVNPVVAHLTDDSLDRRNPRIPDGVENVMAVEELPVSLRIEEVELVLHPHHGLVAELSATLQHTMEHVTR